MKRLFWLALGVTVGVLVMRRLSRAAAALSPSGVGGSLQGLAETVRDFADEVREAMSARESEMLEGSGIDGRLGARPEDFR